jgi:hypothetical protein
VYFADNLGCHRSEQPISIKEQATRTAKTEVVNIEH